MKIYKSGKKIIKIKIHTKVKVRKNINGEVYLKMFNKINKIA